MKVLLTICLLFGPPADAAKRSRLAATLDGMEQSLRDTQQRLEAEMLARKRISPDCLALQPVEPYAWQVGDELCRIMAESHEWIDAGPWLPAHPTARPVVPLPGDPALRAERVETLLHETEAQVTSLVPGASGVCAPAKARSRSGKLPAAVPLSERERSRLRDRDTAGMALLRLRAIQWRADLLELALTKGCASAG